MKTSKSKAEAVELHYSVRNERDQSIESETDIIARMEANQAIFGLPSREVDERVGKAIRKVLHEQRENLQLMQRTVFPSILESAEDERREHENDLRHESLMADESEHGPQCNLCDEEAWRQ